jgi:hypothetical protein
LYLLPGLAVFLLDQAFNVASLKIALPAISAYSYGLIFLVIGVAGFALTRILEWGRGEFVGWRRALLVGIAYAGVEFAQSGKSFERRRHPHPLSMVRDCSYLRIQA